MWVSTGRTFSWLHFLPLLVGFCVVIFLQWTSVMSGRKTNSKKLTMKLTSTKPVSPFWKKSFEAADDPLEFSNPMPDHWVRAAAGKSRG